jgi:hypothetical protein
MKYDPHYYIQKIGDSIDSLPYVEVTVDNTKIIVVNIRAGRELIYKVYFTNFSMFPPQIQFLKAFGTQCLV